MSIPVPVATLKLFPESICANIRVLVLDIDGTIAGDSNQINAPVLTALQAAKAQGIQVAIATGRMYQSALRFHQQVGSTLPLICYQGALIRDPFTEVIHRHWAVPPEIAQQLLDCFNASELRSQVAIHLYVDDQLYVAEMSALTESYLQRSNIQPQVVENLAEIAQKAPTKVLALSQDPDLISQLMEQMQAIFSPKELYLTRSIPTFFEATNPQVNKGTAVRYLAEELLHLDASQVMAIGDSWNDLEMLEYAGLGIAMGSAPIAVKQIANWVAPDVEADGVAVSIQHCLQSCLQSLQKMV